MTTTSTKMQPPPPLLTSLPQRLADIFSTLTLLLLCLTYLPALLIAHPIMAITDFPAFQFLWFGRVWARIGPQMALSPEQVDHIEALFSRAHGTVLEIGPGGGDQMYHFASVADKIHHVYGAEPTLGLHDALQAKARAHGLAARYTCLDAGAEPESLLPALVKAGVLGGNGEIPRKGVFDTVICVKSLCSVQQSEMERICETVQALLRPGGEFVFFEHVENYTDPWTRRVVRGLNVVWPVVMGGCRLNGKVDRVVGRMGGWEKVDVRTTEQFMGYNMFRYAIGVCRK